MTVAPVGLRCPEHAGKQRPVRQAARTRVQRPLARRGLVAGSDAIVTRVLIAVNVLVYLIGVGEGGGLNSPDGSLYEKWWLYGPAVAHGDWWRLITSAFLHASLIHIAFNMLALLWFGDPVERYLGHWRFLLVYIVSGLAGSAGALIANPHAVTVGASGAIFGMLGAMLIIEWQLTGSLAGNALTLIVINLAFSFAVPNISYGGHLGGLAGGILATLALSRFGRGHAAYGRVGLVGVMGVVAIGIASVAIAILKSKGQL
jgi:membrane associated rhomboid family serine protease